MKELTEKELKSLLKSYKTILKIMGMNQEYMRIVNNLNNMINNKVWVIESDIKNKK